MFERIKYNICLNSVNKNIVDGDFEVAFEKLNYFIKKEFKLSETMLIRGRLCKKLLMYEDAYSDFTYVITHCTKNIEAYYERLFLNYEIANYKEAISDADYILAQDKNNFEIKRIKFLSFVHSENYYQAKVYLDEIFDFNKHKAIGFILKESNISLSKNEFSKSLNLLKVIDMIDKNNPVRFYEEAHVYEVAGQYKEQIDAQHNLERVFPEYFISHYKTTDMFSEKNYDEICFLHSLSKIDKKSLFKYQTKILEGYKNHIEGHIIDTKECFEEAVSINPYNPEGYVLLAETLQLMSGYDDAEYKEEAIKNYRQALEIYDKQGLSDKVEDVKRQISNLSVNLF